MALMGGAVHRLVTELCIVREPAHDGEVSVARQLAHVLHGCTHRGTLCSTPHTPALSNGVANTVHCPLRTKVSNRFFKKSLYLHAEQYGSFEQRMFRLEPYFVPT